MINKQTLLELKEICTILHIGPSTAYKLFRSGKLAGAFKLGHSWRISQEDLNKYIDSLK